MTTPFRPVLAGRRALVAGIANEHSIAWGCAKAFRELGAEVAVTYLNDKAKPYVEPLARQIDSPLFLPLDVSKPGELEAAFPALFEGLAEAEVFWPREVGVFLDDRAGFDLGD